MWLVGPITDELGSRRLAELPARDAVDVLEPVAWLQAVRAGLVCIPILAGAAVLDGTGVDRGWAPVLWTLTLSGVLVLPFYGLLVAVMQLRLRRRSRLPEGPHTPDPCAQRKYRSARMCITQTCNAGHGGPLANPRYGERTFDAQTTGGSRCNKGNSPRAW